MAPLHKEQWINQFTLALGAIRAPLYGDVGRDRALAQVVYRYGGLLPPADMARVFSGIDISGTPLRPHPL
jgi:hypothetical protein